jgi:hypothetical protein
MPTRTGRRPQILHVTAKLKQGRQTIGAWDVTVDPTDTAALRTLLARLLAERGIDDPGPTHRVQLYEADTGKWLMEVTAG